MDRKGAGNDFELGPGSEHAVEIIILESLARMDATYRNRKWKSDPSEERLVISVLSIVSERVSEMAREICGLLVAGEEFGERG